jgi:hypothetical protein
MPITKDNVDAILQLLLALDQRADAIRQLASNLSVRTVWRSPDGKLALDLTTAEQETIEGFVRQYVKECRQVLAAIDAAFGPPPLTP